MSDTVQASPLVQYLNKAPAIQIINGPVFFKASTLIEMTIPESGEEDYALAFEWATTDGDLHGLYLTEEQVLSAKSLGDGRWEFEATSEPDFVGEDTETFQIRGVKLVLFGA